jgi:arylsulfatase A-like enzyme
MPLLRGKPLPPRSLYWHMPNYANQGGRPSGAIRDGDWKLVALADKPWELYEMDNDRVEMHNLASSNPAKVKELETKWNAWAERANVFQKEAAGPAHNQKPSASKSKS